jgi:hypothetical protein
LAEERDSLWDIDLVAEMTSSDDQCAAADAIGCGADDEGLILGVVWN